MTGNKEQAVETTEKGGMEIERMAVKISHLDTLLGLTGEIIIAASNISILQRHLNTSPEANVDKDTMEMVKLATMTTSRISSDLHHLVMDIRMVPIKETFLRFRRLVRDTAKKRGRQVNFEIVGEDTLVDKTVAERLYEPLAHQIRNAVDHGIEDPLDRQHAGKAPTGNLTLTAYKKEGFTYVSVADDGKGLDVPRIREVAQEKGLVANGAAMSAEEAWNMIMTPGFSTAREATEISGRGVGMDVVKSTVESMGGEVLIESAPGQGSEFTYKIPQLSAVNITDAVIIRADEQYFAVPVGNVVATQAVKKSEVNTTMGRDESILYLNSILPLHDLLYLLTGNPLKSTSALAEDDSFAGFAETSFSESDFGEGFEDFASVEGLEDPDLAAAEDTVEDLDEAELLKQREEEEKKRQAEEEELIKKAEIAKKQAEDETMPVIIIEAKNGRIACKVSEFIRPQKLVLIPLPEGFKVTGISGTTILGGSQLGMIIEPFELIAMASGTSTEMDIVSRSSISMGESDDGGMPSIPLGDDPAPAAKAAAKAPPAGAAKTPAATPDQVNRLEMESGVAEEFFVEIQDILKELNEDIFQLEKEPESIPRVNTIFRHFHSIKGNFMMTGFSNVGGFVHEVESVLDRIREKTLEVNQEIIDLLLDAVKNLEGGLALIRAGRSYEITDPDLLATLARYHRKDTRQIENEAEPVDDGVFQMSPLGTLLYHAKMGAPGVNVFQSMIQLKSSFQDPSLVAYLIIKRLTLVADIIDTVPTLERIERGLAKNKLKIMFASRYSLEEINKFFNRQLVKYYSVEMFENLLME